MGAEAETLNQWTPAPGLVDEWRPRESGPGKVWVSPCGRVKVEIAPSPFIAGDWMYFASLIDGHESVRPVTCSEAAAKRLGLESARELLAKLDTKAAPADEWRLHPTGAREWTSPCGRVSAQVWANTHDHDWRWVVDGPGPGRQTHGNPATSMEAAQGLAVAEAWKRLDALDAAKPDPINHPTHYTASPYESITVIESVGSGFCRGNALKYLCRAPHKGTEAADLRKAAWYVRRLVTARESFTPMGTTGAYAVAESWASCSETRHDAILSLLTGKDYMGDGPDDFDAEAVAVALEAAAYRACEGVGK